MHSINVIRDASEQLKHIIDDILDISTIEMGNLNIEKERFDFEDFLNYIKDSYSKKYTKKDILFTIKKDKSIPRYINGDKYRLQQVIENILDNAYKFTDQGRINLTVKEVESNGKATNLEFIIKDTGIGISADKHESIFESFSQVQTSNNRGGTGLGLSIVKHLLNLMDGKVSVKSKPNRGSTFTVCLKFEVSENQNPSEKPKELLEKGQANKNKKYSVLIADDIESIQLLLMKILINQKDFYFDIANNGDQVIELLHKNKYDLILMDIKMPTMDGYDTTHYIRQSSKSDFRDIPIIAVTAKASALERQKCLDVGMNDYVGKPFQEQELIDKIKNILNKKEAN